ncbi:MAG TPA: hypothetical protein VGB17_02145 [Pyrinomonadaceae bacterium]|jgi:PleD family two-component response regulator
MSLYVLAAVEEMFFASRIRAVAAELAIEVRFEKSTEAVLAAARAAQPTLIIADLHAQRCDPLALARSLKSDEELKAVPLVGFFSHVHTALQRETQSAGFNRLLPRSAFTKRLPEILQGNLS